MLSSHVDKLIRQWGERFRQDPLASRIAASLYNRSHEIRERTFELLQRESSEYRNSIDDEFTKESKSHCNELLKTIIAVAAGLTDKAGTEPFNVVRTHAEWRARHQVPLIASLHAYRLAHRAYWTITRESLLPHARHRETIRSLTTLSDFWIEFFDHVGAVLAESHAVEEGLIVAQSTSTYVALIDDLLGGREPRDAEARRLCALCGIRPGSPIAVLIAHAPQPGNGGQIDLEPTLRSFVRLIEQALPPATFGKLVDIRNGEVIAIACSTADSGRAVMQALRRTGFARRTGPGHGVSVGISLDAVEISRLPAALEEARLALEFASAAQPLMHFS